MIESQIGYAMDALRVMRETKQRELEVRRAAQVWPDFTFRLRGATRRFDAVHDHRSKVGFKHTEIKGRTAEAAE